MEIELEIDGWRKRVEVPDQVMMVGFFDLEPPLCPLTRFTVSNGRTPQNPSYQRLRFYRVPNYSGGAYPLFRAEVPA